MKILKHELCTILIGLAGLALILVPCGCRKCTGILQGIGTGLIAGVVLLLVSAAKEEEEHFSAKLAEQLNDLYEG